MQKLIDQLYYLVNNPLVTPSKLVNNAKLPEYRTISFEKHGNGLMATMEYLSGGDIIEFKYYFDSQDNLKRAISIDLRTNNTEVIFDRIQEVKQLESRIVRNRATEKNVAM